jgi:hypothetical protein
MKRAAGVIASISEYLIAALFVWGGVTVYDEAAVNSEYNVLDPLLGRTAIVLYATIFLTLGLTLAAGKLFKLRRTHGHSLFVITLVIIYVVILNLLLGETWVDQLANMVLGLVTAALWLRWRYKVIFNQLD